VALPEVKFGANAGTEVMLIFGKIEGGLRPVRVAWRLTLCCLASLHHASVIDLVHLDISKRRFPRRCCHVVGL
jgi:hypothetical protein